jgi:predicted RNA binding protein YcfA (HicA-like mRNA interferase family)
MRIILRGEAMKRRKLIKKLLKNGWWLERKGRKHDIYTNGIKSEPIPRHNELDEMLAHAIIKRQGLK